MVRARVPERVTMMVSGQRRGSVFDGYKTVSDADLRLVAKRQAA